MRGAAGFPAIRSSLATAFQPLSLPRFGDPVGLTFWQAGAQQAAPLPLQKRPGRRDAGAAKSNRAQARLFPRGGQAFASEASLGDVSCRGVLLRLAGRFWDAQVALSPFVEDVKAPGARPSGAAAEEISPHGLCEAAVEAGFQGGRPITELGRHAFTQFAAQPGFPRKCESTFGLIDDFRGQQIFQGCDEQGFWARGIALQGFG